MAHSGTIIHMRNVPGDWRKRALDAPLPCKNRDGSDGEVPQDFEWDGSSSELISESSSKIKRFFIRIAVAPVNFFMRSIFPRHNHPIASCRHDWRCLHAKNAEERKWADGEFKKDVATTSKWITQACGYAGVRIGAYLGIGNRF
jgi:hypothetical protein